mmetsp:Transcript_34848/g.63659  ORF Transcript_34848/g.63659 Transcript_34848/m.63659 type:complete len:95 (-) Transcript_34848:43-327(-)
MRPAPEARQTFLLLKIVALSGRSCYVALPEFTVLWAPSLDYALAIACEKLGMQRRGTEMLLHGSETVPVGNLEVRQWPGSPEPGRVVEYQLVRW